jgi:hypothetical protein
MKIVFLILMPFWLFASQILNYNVYDRTERVDLMLTFDTPYEGEIRQQKQSGNILIKLSDVSIESPKVKNLNSKILNKITITPIGAQVEIVARVPENITLQASKTSDAYGLRLRFIKAGTSQKKNLEKENPLSALPTKQSSELEDNYMIVVIILVLGIIILLWFKRSLASTAGKTSKSSLFKSNKSDSSEARIRFQKPLDQHNSVMMLDYAQESYLVIIGTNNVVLDKFHDDKPVTQGEFESMLNNKEQELDSYLHLDKIDKVDANEILESYKERASN